MARHAKRCLEIHYPLAGETVVPVLYTDPDTKQQRYFFAAYGRVRGSIADLAAWLHLKGSDPIRGKILRPRDFPPDVLPMYWIIGFEQIPVGLQEACRLQVAEPDADEKKGLCKTVEFSILDPKKVKGGYGGTIPVQCPQSGNTYCPTNFVASGTLCNNSPTVSAQMIPPAHIGIPGTLLAGVPPGTWAYQFPTLPEGSGYTFMVVDQLTDHGGANHITIDSSACTEIECSPPASTDSQREAMDRTMRQASESNKKTTKGRARKQKK